MFRRSFFLFALFLLGLNLGAQDALISQQSLLRRQQEITALEPDEAQRAAVEFVRKHRLPERIVYRDGTIMEVRRLSSTGIPMYYTTFNRISAETISTDKVWEGGEAGLDLDGTGIVIGVWDGGTVRVSHDEFKGRARILDGANDPIDHGTHVAGTLGAAGIRPQAQGMANKCLIDSYDWDNETSEIRNAAGNGLLISNHSYGFIHGWNYNTEKSRWEWYGDVSISEKEDYGFGYYGPDARIWDQIMNDYPRYMLVKSAGNDRGEGPAPGTSHYYYDNFSWQLSTTPRDLDGGTSGYDCIGTSGTAKNILTVGAVEDIPGGYTQSSDVSVASFSAFGPTDDGRIKPDLVANGVSVYSCLAESDSDYGYLSGTSMSAPSVSGSLALLQQHYTALHGTPMYASQLKALVLHTADEAGNEGPDYKYGWGLMNTEKAAGLISTLPDERFIYDELNNQEAKEYLFYSPGTSEIRVTLVWNDPSGKVPEAKLDPTDRILVNDLDLTLTRQVDSHVYMPFVLDPVNPGKKATTGDNNLDNVEQIRIDAPSPGFYTLRLNHDGSLAGGKQAYALVVTGMEKDFIATGLNILEESNGSLLLSSANEYLNDMQVAWRIQPENGLPVSLYFDRLSTETGKDVLTIYDGSDTLAPVLASFSGSLDNPDTILTSTDTMFVTFVSDSQVTGQGFLARYCTVAPEGSYAISGEEYPCSESVSPYFATGQSGAYFSWESGEWIHQPITTNGIDLTIGNGPGILTVHPYNRCGTGTGTDFSIEPQVSAPVLESVTGDTVPCAGTGSVLMTTNVPGAVYQWELPESWVGSSTTDTVYFIPGTNSGTVTVKSSNACGEGDELQQYIVVEDVPSRPSILTDKVPPCALTTQKFYVASHPGHSFHWETQDDWQILGEDNGDTVTIRVGEAETFLYVTEANQCGETESSRLFLTSAVPPVPELIKYDGPMGLPELEVTNRSDFASIRWYRNGNPIEGTGGTANPLLVNLNGTYWAESVSSEGCLNPESSGLQLEVNRIPLSFLAYRISEITIMVENTTSGTVNVRIYSLLGQVVYNGTVAPGQNEIGFLGRGVYLFRFTGGELDQEYRVFL